MIFLYLYIILAVLFVVGLPVIIILVIIRAVGNHGQKTGEPVGTGLHAPIHELSTRQVVLGVVLSSAAYAGVAAFYILPTWLLSMNSESSIFAVRLIAGLIVLTAGLLLLRYRLASILLMAVGVLTILLATPYIFSNFGSAGALLVIFVVLIALIGLAVYFSKKEHKK
jgi:hypothetical protein